MTFFQAIQAVMIGKKISRPEWGGESYAFLHSFSQDGDEYLCIHNALNNPNPQTKAGIHTFAIRSVDMMADDWIILTEGYNQ